MINEVELNVWERKFVLPVRYDCFDDEEVTDQQETAVNNFISHPKWLDAAKRRVEEYCHSAVESDCQNQKKDNIFSYIRPEYLYVKRDERRNYSRLALMLKYKYDIGHGLAVIFNDNGDTNVSSQDEIL